MPIHAIAMLGESGCPPGSSTRGGEFPPLRPFPSFIILFLFLLPFFPAHFFLLFLRVCFLNVKYTSILNFFLSLNLSLSLTLVKLFTSFVLCKLCLCYSRSNICRASSAPMAPVIINQSTNQTFQSFHQTVMKSFHNDIAFSNTVVILKKKKKL